MLIISQGEPAAPHGVREYTEAVAGEAGGGCEDSVFGGCGSGWHSEPRICL
jgi:hypothetical protein